MITFRITRSIFSTARKVAEYGAPIKMESSCCTTIICFVRIMMSLFRSAMLELSDVFSVDVNAILFVTIVTLRNKYYF